MKKINYIFLLSIIFHISFCGGSSNSGMESIYPFLLSQVPPQPEKRSNSLTLSPSSLSFGNTYIFSTTGSSNTLSIKNSGTFTLNIKSIFSINDAFTASSSSLSLAAGAETTITITFKPKELKTYSSTILFYNDSKEVINSLAVSGKGVSYSELNCSSTSSAIRVKNVSGGTATVSMYADENSCNKDLTNTSGSYVFSGLSDSSTTVYYCLTSGTYFIGYIGTTGSGTCTTSSYSFSSSKDYTMTKYSGSIQVKEDSKN